MTPSSPPWYATAFDQSYLALYAHRDQRDARRAFDFLLGEKIVRKGELGLDLCCGAGRHLVELLAAGMNVVGVDLSPALLASAQRNLAEDRLKSLLVRGSMDHLPFKSRFDYVINLFTSFGYFELDTDNERVLQNVSQALRPRGRFLIDFLNESFIRATLKRQSVERTPQGQSVHVRRSIEGASPRVVKRMALETGAGPIEIVESVRLFTRDELTAMLERSGLRVTKSWGDFCDRRAGEMAPRCILLAEKC